jgi:hypothetical protein
MIKLCDEPFINMRDDEKPSCLYFHGKLKISGLEA